MHVINKLLSADDEKEREKGLIMLKKEMFGLIISMILKGGTSKEEAEEIFWDGLLVVDNNARKQRFGPDDNIQGYLKTTCRNIWLKKGERKKLKFNSIDDHVDFLAENDVPNSTLLDEELKSKLVIILNQLKTKCQTILKLAFLDGLDHEEIQQYLNFKSIDVVKTSKNRCMKKLREIVTSLGGKGFFND